MKPRVKTLAICGGVMAIATATVFAQNNQLGRVERVDKVYGKTVYSSDNQKVGNLNNLVVDLESGRILYAVVASSKGRVAVAPQIFTQTPADNDKNVRANVPKAKIDDAPQFGNYDKPEDLGKAEFVNQVYQHFGKPAWWQGGNQAANVGSFHNVHKASETIGMSVLNINNASLGKVNNLAVDLPAGRVTYVILAPNSNMNLGNNLYALPPDAFTLSADKRNLVSNIDQAKLAAAPHFDKNGWATLSDASFASQVYQYYGKQAYFGNDALRPTGR